MVLRAKAERGIATMTPGNWVILGWFFGAPSILFSLWIGQVGPAANFGWGIVLAPWPIGIAVLFAFWMLGAFDKENDTSEGNH